jgi:hypothetical protein
MTVSRDNSEAVYQGIRSAGVRFLTALPETWLVYLLQLGEDDAEMTLVEVAKEEEEAIGIAAGSYFAGAKNALLMQNHGFLASINGIDNGSLLSTGGFVSHTASGRTDLAGVARAAGCPRVLEAQTLFQFMEAVAEAFAAGEMTTIVAKVEAVGPDRFHMELALPENAFQFRRAAAVRE